MPVRVPPEVARRLLAEAGEPMPEPKRSKYRNVRTEYAGVLYDSRAEARRAEELDRLKLAGEVIEVVRQPKFRLGARENVYIADFLVIARDGVRVEDCKGSPTAKFKRDVALWRRYGRLPLHILYRDRTEVVEGGGVVLVAAKGGR